MVASKLLTYMHHWAQNLSEGKRIYKEEVFYLKNLKLKLGNLKFQIENIEAEICVYEADLLNSVKKQYTSVEIEEAINQFMK